MIRCAECGQTDCDKESCPGWSTDRSLFDRTWTEESFRARSDSLEPLFMAGLIAFPRETPADRHRFAMQFQQQPYPRDEDAQCE